MPRSAALRPALKQSAAPHSPKQQAHAPGALAPAPEPRSMCRLCWGDDEEPGNELISACACSGSLKHIHQQCLADWQRTLRAQGQARRAAACELCLAPYRLPPAARQRPSARRLAARARSRLARSLLEATAAPWPALLLRVWRSYVMLRGVSQALRLGASGFSAGLSIGRSLVQEQAGLLHGALHYTSSLLGSPYAEMLWCQAVGALFVGMLSELVYTSILGLLGGLAYGFCMGYATALKGSVRLLSLGSLRLGSSAAALAARCLRHALRLVARV